MKHYKPALLLAATLLALPVLSQNQTASGPTQYMTIVAEMAPGGLLSPGKSIFISQLGENYKEVRLDKKASQGNYDFNQVIRIIQEYNRQGWKVVTSNLSANKQVPQRTLYILMERTQPAPAQADPADTIPDKPGHQQEFIPMDII